MATRRGARQLDPIHVLRVLDARSTRPARGPRSGSVPPLVTPLVILVLGTAFFRLSHADVAISQWFYGGGSGHGWPLLGAEPWKSIYRYGVVPAWALAVGGLVVALLSFGFWRLKRWRRAGLFLALLLLLGPGLLVNALFKPHWMRPRPSQTAAFGGAEQFEPVWDMGQSTQSRSFPSGHASMGFYLMAPAFLLYRRRRRLAVAFFAAGLAGGMVMGLTRIVQGGHFASDVLWSAGCVYLTGLLLYVLLRLHEDRQAVTKPDQGPVVPYVVELAEPDEASEIPDYRRAA
jgi:membrane-associated PAP2 superfamily phosphatase